MVTQLRILAVFALLLGGCRASASDIPNEGHLELCCKAANPDNVSFVGCRSTSRCRARESVWVRGPISCSRETNCAGGHCCRLDVEALAEHVEAPLALEQLQAPTLETANVPEPLPIIPMPLEGAGG